MIKHPLGIGAKLGQDHRTAGNRLELLTCIRLYLSGAFERINTSREGDSVTGMQLDRKFVTALELANALEELATERPSIYYILKLLLIEGWTRDQVCQAIHVGGKTLRTMIDDGLDLMIERIWRD